jgi:hypothetical protein
MFQPFTGDLWIAISVLYLILVFTLHFIEHPASKRKVADQLDKNSWQNSSFRNLFQSMHTIGGKPPSSKGRQRKAELPRAAQRQKRPSLAKAKEKATGCLNGVFDDDVWGDGFTINSTEGRGLQFLLAFFSFIVTACYTANLVAFLAVERNAPVFDSRQSFMGMQQTACTLGGLEVSPVQPDFLLQDLTDCLLHDLLRLTRIW